MGEALPSHQADMIWAENLVHGEWVYVQTAVGQSLSVFVLKKAVMAEPKRIASSVTLELEI